MKICHYCGRENSKEAGACHGCGTEIEQTRKEAAPIVQPLFVPTRPATDLSELDMDFSVVEGFSHPNWKSVHACVERTVPELDLEDAWNCIAERWLEQLATDLGGKYGIHRSQNFLCLSELEREECEQLLAFAEKGLSVIRTLLGPAAWTGYHGRHVLVVISEEDDYYSYISYFYRDGLHPATTGVFLGAGYWHIALKYADLRSAERLLTHELTHDLLSHLDIPRWLNEGIAQEVERLMARQGFSFDGENVQRHYAFWTARNIQEFWSGRSFQCPGESTELSYELAQILLNLLSPNGAAFAAFVQNADYLDGGQNAALTVLGCDLGEILGEFLGPGAWRPQRQSIRNLLSSSDEPESPDPAAAIFWIAA